LERQFLVIVVLGSGLNRRKYNKEMPLHEITKLEDLPSIGKAVIFYFAFWHEACAPLIAVLDALTTTAPDISFFRADADQAAALTTAQQVTVVPTVLFLVNGVIVERLEGESLGDPSQLTLGVQRLQSKDISFVAPEPSATPASKADPEKELTQRLDRLIRRESVMLFMKGTPSAPRCGFSRQAVEMLQEEQIPFGSFDILTDEVVRQGLKKHSNWATYPQLYVNGELCGGLDIMKEMKEDGPLKEQWGIEDTATPIESLNDRLAKLIKRHDCMLFMKGLPSAPKCGFSRKIVEILEKEGASYDAFNILEDEEVRQGLKEFSNWPTYPQLYVKGELVGGLDIVQELAEGGELKDMLQQ
jgi:Grx4 family monothiol glutaredoxin